MKKATGALIVLLAVAGMVSGCNSANNITAPPGTGTNCGGPPSSNQLEVLRPIPNSKNVPPGIANIYFSTKGQLPVSNQYNFILVLSNGNQFGTGPFQGISAKQIPEPHATPTYSNAVYYASAIAGPSGSQYVIGPDQSVSVFWNIYGSGCNPHTLITSFKTKS